MIGALLIIFAIFALMILLFPVTISVNSAGTEGKITGYFSLEWIMFLFRYAFKDRQTEILVFRRRIARLPQKEKPQKSAETKKHRKIKKSKKILHSGDIFYLSRPILRLFKDLIYSFRLKYLNIDITFGLNDPACTGIMTGFMYSILGFLKEGYIVRWTADFTKPVLEWDMKAQAAVTPIQILPPVARFITNRQVLRSGLHIFRY